MTDKKATKFGFVSVLGAPNAGKSTLTNTLVGEKISIVTHKVQTTRTRIMGIYLYEQSQVALIDTPGIFTPTKRVDRAMVAAAWDGAKDADINMLLIDVSNPKVFKQSETILERLKDRANSTILVLNKIDLIQRDDLLSLSKLFNEAVPFSATFMISAIKGSGVNELKEYLANHVPEGPWMYDPDQVSTIPMRMLAAEITREKLFLQVHKELPYALTVQTENWENFENGDVKISQVIVVERESQRAIVLGKNGQKIKKIGQDAREELTEMLGQTVHIKLFVKVRQKWQDDPSHYSHWGLDYNA